MPERPLVLFDGNCGFCRTWIDYFQALIGAQVDYAPTEEIAPKSVRIKLRDGQDFSGARAVLEMLRYAPGFSGFAWLYGKVPLFAAVSEWAYRLVAGHRPFFDKVTRLFFGLPVLPLSYVFIEWLFVRALALIYLIAFVSFGTQVRGLIGSHGILPVHSYLQALVDSFGFSRYWLVPTVLWLRHDDVTLVWTCIAGAGLAIVLVIGFAQRLVLLSLYVLYLSLCAAGQDFMSFQWDMLLLETGFLAIFLGHSKLVVWLMRWLLFRLMFLSGSVKLLSHDPAWRSFHAMEFHYWTQPLPTPVAWYMNQLPARFHQASTAVVFVCELLVPLLIFGPRRVRHFAAFSIIALQILILTTGNYTFFNILTIALCLFLFDDRSLPNWHRRTRITKASPRVALAVALVVLILSGSQLLGTFLDVTPSRALLRLAAPFGIVNTYGLFAVMTTERPEIVVQGSNDGANWLDYTFQYKPGDLRRAPPWVAPHDPRLDWQMWFASLSTWRNNPWFANFMVRLLEGSGDVLDLLGPNPFPATPPRYVRALSYDYRFTNFEERHATGAWWHREPKGTYFPAISMSDVRP